MCILIEKICGCVRDCGTGEDEEECPATCDLESGDMCRWTNAADNDMKWEISQTSLPPFDHTKGDATGHFLHFKGMSR